jgi:hypothetical protein
MGDLHLTYNQITTYFIIGNIILGILFGLFPLIVGLKLKNRKYGVFGFVGAIVGGGILGLVLSFPVAFVFTWLILRGYAQVGEPGPGSSVSEPAAENL